MALVIGLRCSRLSCFCSDFEKWCRGDWSRASLVPIAHRFAMHSVIPPCLPLMASSTASVGDLGVVTSGLPRPMVAPVLGVSGGAPGDAASAPGSSVAMGLGVLGLYLTGSPGFPPLPIN
jgi:hypothetical protein